MIKKKTNYDVETKAKCLDDTATGQAGAVAFQTFRAEDVEVSNDYNIPYHAICSIKVKTTTEEVEYDDPTCIGDEPDPPQPGDPYIEGADNTTIPQGTDFDPNEGVKAYDGHGDEIPFTVEPSELDTCEVGVHELVYTATDSQGKTVTVIRKVTITAIPNPTIDGITDIVVAPDEEFNPLDGVTAVDGNGNPIPVEVKE